MKLYDSIGPNPRIVRIFMAEKGIEAVSRQLATHFPRQGGGRNELPDTPVVM